MRHVGRGQVEDRVGYITRAQVGSTLASNITLAVRINLAGIITLAVRISLAGSITLAGSIVLAGSITLAVSITLAGSIACLTFGESWNWFLAYGGCLPAVEGATVASSSVLYEWNKGWNQMTTHRMAISRLSRSGAGSGHVGTSSSRLYRAPLWFRHPYASDNVYK